MAAKTKSPEEGAKKKAREEGCWLAQLESHVLHTRGEIRDIAAQLTLNMEAALAQIAKDAETIAPDSKRCAFCRRAIDELDALKIKPRKGRLRDLKRIDALLKALAEEIGAMK